MQMIAYSEELLELSWMTQKSSRSNKSGQNYNRLFKLLTYGLHKGFCCCWVNLRGRTKSYFSKDLIARNFVKNHQIDSILVSFDLARGSLSNELNPPSLFQYSQVWNSTPEFWIDFFLTLFNSAFQTLSNDTSFDLLT